MARLCYWLLRTLAGGQGALNKGFDLIVTNGAGLVFDDQLLQGLRQAQSKGGCRLIKALEQGGIVVAVSQHPDIGSAALDAEAALLEPHRAGETILAGTAKQQEHFLADAVAQLGVAVGDIEDILAEGELPTWGPLERLKDLKSDHDGVEILKLRVRFGLDTRHPAENDVLGLVCHLDQIQLDGQPALLGRSVGNEGNER